MNDISITLCTASEEISRGVCCMWGLYLLEFLRVALRLSIISPCCVEEDNLRFVLDGCVASRVKLLGCAQFTDPLTVNSVKLTAGAREWRWGWGDHQRDGSLRVWIVSSSSSSTKWIIALIFHIHACMISHTCMYIHVLNRFPEIQPATRP
jgi:hypothetical protein